MMEHRFGARPVRPAKPPPGSLVRGPGAHIKGCVVVQDAAACIKLEEELIVLETDEARAQLDCKAVL